MEHSPLECSLVFPYGCHSSKACGYCKGTNDGLHTTWGMGTERLTVYDYQYLIDRGWRRSGTYCYKPLNAVTCCPCYTIRCDALRFRPSRSHKRLIRQIASFLETGERKFLKSRIESLAPSDSSNLRTSSIPLTAGGDTALSSFEHDRRVLSDDLHMLAEHTSASGDNPYTSVSTVSRTDSPSAHSAAQLDHDGDTNLISLKPSKSTKSRVRRWETKLNRMKSRAAKEKRSFEDILKEYRERRQRRLQKNRPKELEELLQCIPPREIARHYIEIHLVRSHPPNESLQQSVELEHHVYQKYQMTVHQDPPAKCDMNSFTRFLIDSPLVPDPEQITGMTSDTAPPFGSYHQQYWLDGDKLIAVGVIDLLPQCLSSVYLFYDPDYSFLQLGTYSALREIAFVRELAHRFGPTSPCPVSRYAHFTSYYMGYFIRSCPKMSYKAKFHPSYLACPETYTWIPLEQCLSFLDSSSNGKYCRFSPPSASDPFAIDALISNDISSVDQYILCHIRYKDNKKRRFRGVSKTVACPLSPAIQLDRLKSSLNPTYVNKLREWAVLIGKRVTDGYIRITFD